MSRKKVIIRRFTPGLLAGYLSGSGFQQGGNLDLLDLSGRVLPVPLETIKMVSFVRDFNTADTVNPERLLRKTFPSRPRTEGLWVRLQFKDEDVLEGLAPLDLSLLEGAVEDQGILITPPDVRGNVQRIYVPRVALTGMTVLAVITTPSRKKPTPVPSEPQEREQKDLFGTMISTRLH